MTTEFRKTHVLKKHPAVTCLVTQSTRELAHTVLCTKSNNQPAATGVLLVNCHFTPFASTSGIDGSLKGLMKMICWKLFCARVTLELPTQQLNRNIQALFLLRSKIQQWKMLRQNYLTESFQIPTVTTWACFRNNHVSVFFFLFNFYLFIFPPCFFGSNKVAHLWAKLLQRFVLHVFFMGFLFL